MYNKAILVGRIGQDPEMRYIPSGTAVTNFSIATNRKWRDKAGNLQEETTWHDIVCWGKTAEFIAEYGGKGRLVFVDGEIRKRNWDDKNGIRRTTVEINARNVQLLDRAPEGMAGRSQSPGAESPVAESPVADRTSKPDSKPDAQSDANVPDNTEDDVPF